MLKGEYKVCGYDGGSASYVGTRSGTSGGDEEFAEGIVDYAFVCEAIRGRRWLGSR